MVDEPMGTVSKIPKIFEKDYYQRLYEIEQHHGWARGLRKTMDALLRDELTDRHPLRVLDVGCGTGYLLEYIQRYHLAGEPVGIDISSYALDFCRARGDPLLVRASAVEIPLASNSFDLIICIDTIQHLSPTGVDLALVEFARLLRPGGCLYLRTNSALGHPPLSGVDPDLYRRYRVEDVVEMLTDFGFQVARASYVNAIPGVWGMVREYLQAGRRRADGIGPGLAIQNYPPHMAWMNHSIYWILSLEAWIMTALGIDFPFGHSTAFVARRVED